MPIFIGNNKVNSLYYDGERVGKMYVDGELVFSGLKLPKYSTVVFNQTIDVSGLQAILEGSELMLFASVNSPSLEYTGFSFVTKLKVNSDTGELVYTVYGNDNPGNFTEEVVYTPGVGWKQGFNDLTIVYGLDIAGNDDLYRWFYRNSTIILNSEPTPIEEPMNNTIYKNTKIVFNDILDLRGLFNIVNSTGMENVVYFPQPIYFNIPTIVGGISMSFGIMKNSGDEYSLWYATTNGSDGDGYTKVTDSINEFITNDYKSIVIQNDVTLPDDLFKWILDNSNLGTYVTIPANTVITFNSVLDFDGFKEATNILVSLPNNYYYSLLSAETYTGGPPEIPLTAIAMVENRDNPTGVPKSFGYQSNTQGQWYLVYNDTDGWGPYSEWRPIRLTRDWTISNQLYIWLLRNSTISS